MYLDFGVNSVFERVGRDMCTVQAKPYSPGDSINRSKFQNNELRKG